MALFSVLTRGLLLDKEKENHNGPIEETDDLDEKKCKTIPDVEVISYKNNGSAQEPPRNFQLSLGLMFSAQEMKDVDTTALHSQKAKGSKMKKTTYVSAAQTYSKKRKRTGDPGTDTQTEKKKTEQKKKRNENNRTKIKKEEEHKQNQTTQNLSSNIKHQELGASLAKSEKVEKEKKKKKLN